MISLLPKVRQRALKEKTVNLSSHGRARVNAIRGLSKISKISKNVLGV
jgi:hypothetical protein